MAGSNRIAKNPPSLWSATGRHLRQGLGLLTGLSFGLVVAPLSAQSYQSAFSAVAYDRARTPAVFHGDVRVDAASGAVDLSLPLGPGIGRGALKFAPVLTGHFAPLLQARQMSDKFWSDTPPFLWSDAAFSFAASVGLAQDGQASRLVLANAGGASLGPGHLVLMCNSAAAVGAPSNFTLPGGRSGSLAGDVPAGVDTASILAAFGVLDAQPASLPRRTTEAAKSALAMGANGELVIGLTGKAGALMTVAEQAGTQVIQWQLPARVLVVAGDVAVEYGFVNPLYQGLSVPLPRVAVQPDGKKATLLRGGYYLPLRMADRFGESLVFNHFQQPDYLPNYLPTGYSSPAGVVGNGLNLDVVWARNGASVLGSGALTIRGSAGAQETSSPVYALNGKFLSDQGGSQQVTVTVGYPGGVHSGYTLTAYPSEWGQVPVRAPDLNAWERWGPTALVDDAWDHLRCNLQPLGVNQSATGDRVAFSYGQGPAVTYPWGLQTYTPTVLSSVSLPGRTVGLTWKPYPWRANQAPDGEHGFIPAGPVDNPSYAYGVEAVNETAVNTNQARRTTYDRTVPVPDTSLAASSGGTNQGGWTSTTFRTVVTHPDGSVTVNLFAEPVATVNGVSGRAGSSAAEQLQTLGFLKHSVKELRHYAPGADWAADLGTAPESSVAHQVERFDRWSLRRLGNGGGEAGKGSVPYPTRTQTWDKGSGSLTYQELDGWDGTAWPTTVRKAATTGVAASEWSRASLAAGSPAGVLFDRTVSRTFLTPDFGRWLVGRVDGESAVGKPPVSFTYETNSPLVATATVGSGAEAVTTAYTYEAGTPFLKTARLSGAGLTGSGSFGFDYTTDAYGYTNSIQPAGAAWKLGQEQDALGQVASQTDANGLTTTYGWDGAGRLARISPPGELATTLLYPTSFQASVSRGAESAEDHYDGFGQLVRSVRSDGSASSHKRVDYDAAGRRQFETLWLAGAGSDTEVVNPDTSLATYHDGRGRLSSSTVPAGSARVTTTYAYTDAAGGGQSLATATTGTLATTSTRDALGRLVKVQDALGQETRYAYDDADRLARVEQAGESGLQTRTWSYNGLGWLIGLSQPESGATSYGAFTVTGKPGTTTYASGLVLTTTLDALLRPTRIASTALPAGMAAVDQSFAYDETSQGPALGKLTRATDGPVTLRRAYDANGRLGRLDTVLTEGAGPLTYTQTFGYDGYGRRTSASVDGRGVATTYQDATGLATSVSHMGGAVAQVTAVDSTTWLPTTLRFDRTNSRTDLQYEGDQASLKTLVHYPSGSGAPLRQWIYTYDALGRLKGDGEDAWGYDALNRLESATFKPLTAGARTITQGFTYDAFGNPLSSTGAQLGDPASLVNFTFSATDPALTRNRIPAATTAETGGGATGVVYDAQGNLTQIYPKVGDSGHAVSLAYDGLGRVVSLTYYQGSDLMKETYAYTPEGLRTRIEVRRNGGLETVQHKLYDDGRRLVSESEAVYVVR